MSAPNRIPLFPLRTVLFPGMPLPLVVFEPRYRSLVSYCTENKSPFGVVLIESGDEVAKPGGVEPVLKSIGTLARIKRCETLSDGRFLIEALGESRFRLDALSRDLPYPSANVTTLREPKESIAPLIELVETVCRQFRDYVVASMSAHNRQLSGLQLPSDPTSLAFAVASVLDIAPEDKQSLLEADTTFERLVMETELLDLLLTLQGRGRDDSPEPSAKPSTSHSTDASDSSSPANVGSKVTRLDGAAVAKLMSRN